MAGFFFLSVVAKLLAIGAPSTVVRTRIVVGDIHVASLAIVILWFGGHFTPPSSRLHLHLPHHQDFVLGVRAKDCFFFFLLPQSEITV